MMPLWSGSMVTTKPHTGGIESKQAVSMPSFRISQQRSPKIFNLSLDMVSEFNSSVQSILVADGDGGTKVVVVATRDEIIAVQGASWRYELRYDDGTFDEFLSMSSGDVDADGIDEIVVLSEGELMYIINAEDGTLAYKRTTNLGTNFDKICIADVVDIAGKEIIVYSENSNRLHVFTNNGMYLGTITLSIIDDIEYVTAGEINASYAGDELLVLGYDTTSGYYYIAALSLHQYPYSYSTIFTRGLGTNYITTHTPTDIFGLVYIRNITVEFGDELIIVGVRATGSSNIYLTVWNTSGRISQYWPTGITIGTSKKWAYIYFYDFNGDSQEEMVVASKDRTIFVLNYTSYQSVAHPGGLDILGESIYYRSDISNVSALMICKNITEEITYACVVNVSNISTFEVLARQALYTGDIAGEKIVMDTDKYYLYGGGRFFTGTASGSTLSLPEIEYIYANYDIGYPQALPNHEIRPILNSAGWTRVYSYDGSLIYEYRALAGRSTMAVLGYQDYLPGSSGYELAIWEYAGSIGGSPQYYIKLVSGSIEKTYNVSLPGMGSIGIDISPPVPGSNYAILLVYNYTSGIYVLAKLNLDDGSIELGSRLGAYVVWIALIKTYDTYYHIFLDMSTQQTLYFVDPNTAYIVGIKDLPEQVYSGYSIHVVDIDNDGNDEIVMRCYDGTYYYISILNEDMSVETITSASFVSEPIIVDLTDDPGLEIIFSYRSYSYYYLAVYNPTEGFLMSKYIGNYRFYVVATVPPIEVSDDIVVCFLDESNDRLGGVRFLASSEYTDVSIDYWVSLEYDSYTYATTVYTQERTDALCHLIFVSDTGRYALFLVDYLVDYEVPDVELSSPYMSYENITGYIAWNTTIPLTIKASDDTALQYLDLTVTYYDAYGNSLRSDYYYWSSDSESTVTKNVTFELPEDAVTFDLEINAVDVVGRDRYVERYVVVDKYAPTIIPQIPDKINIEGDEEVRISAYIGDDIMVASVYIEFEGRVIPMKTTEEATPEPNELYYYTASIYIAKFSGDKTLRIVARDYVGKTTTYNITIHCEIPITGRTEFKVGLAVGITAAALGVAIFILRKKKIWGARTEE